MAEHGLELALLGEVGEELLVVEVEAHVVVLLVEVGQIFLFVAFFTLFDW